MYTCARVFFYERRYACECVGACIIDICARGERIRIKSSRHIRCRAAAGESRYRSRARFFNERRYACLSVCGCVHIALRGERIRIKSNRHIRCRGIGLMPLAAAGESPVISVA